MIKQPETKRQAVTKLIKELSRYGFEVEIDYPTCEVLVIRYETGLSVENLLQGTSPRWVTKIREM